MAETEKKSEITWQQLGMIVLGVVGLAAYQKRVLIEAWAIQNSDGLMFAAWVGILALIYARLKKTHKNMARERKQLLRLRALEHREHSNNSGRDDGNGGDDDDDNDPNGRGPGKPGPGPSSITSPFPAASREIEVGSRLIDGKRLRLSDRTRLGQVQVPGATGRGKTESIILPWMVQDYGRGRSVILIDGKGDPDLVRRFCKATGATSATPGVLVFDPMNPRSCAINPLAQGSPQQITDRIMSSFQFPDLYYKGVQADAILTVVSLLHHPEDPITFQKIERALTDMDHLSELSNRFGTEALKNKARRLISQREDARLQNLSGVLSQLSPFTTGEMAKLVNGNPFEKGSRVISLMDALVNHPGQKSASLILLPTLVYQDVGRALGRMILQELAYCVGVRASRDGRWFPFSPVFLDEFSSFAYAGFEQILNKARSSGVALHLSHQSMGDLESVSPQFAKIVNTNTNVKCLLGLNDPDTAEFFARHLGTYTTEKFTEKMEERAGLFSTTDERTGMKSVRETESYKIHPNTLKSMSAGQGVLHVPTELGAVTEEVQFHCLDDLDLNPNRRARA